MANRRFSWERASLIVLSACACGWFAACGGAGTPADPATATKQKAEAEKEWRQVRAQTMSQEYVRKFLKFPHDASFPWSEPQIRSNEARDVFYLKGTVEAKNVLGASLTHDWETMVRVDGENWKLVACTIGGEKVYESKEEMAAVYKPIEEEKYRREQAAEQDRKQSEAARKKEEATRDWTSTAGTTLRAEFVEFKNSKAVLRKDSGDEIEVKSSDLSKEDQLWIRERMKRKAKTR